MKQKPLSYLLQGLFSAGLLSAASAFAGGVRIDPVGTKLSAGTVVSGTICGTAPKCEPAMLSYTDDKGVKQFVLLESGTLLAANVHTGSTLVAAKVISYQKIENESISGVVIDGVALDDIVLDGVVVKDAKVVGSSTTIEIGQANNATLKHLSLREAKVAVGTLQLTTAIAAKSTEDKSTVAKPTTAVPKYPEVNYSGDYIHFRGIATGFKPAHNDKAEACSVPPNSCFRVDVDPAAKNETDTVIGTFVTEASESPLPVNPKRMILANCGSPDTNQPKSDEMFRSCAGSTEKGQPGVPPTGISYKVNKATLEGSSRERYGWTYGALVAPIKYYPGQSQFGSNVSINGYLGYRVHDRPGSSSVVALALGQALASVKRADGSTSNVNGASVALAYLAEIKNTFNIGVVLGKDFFSKGDEVPMSGKTYLGLQFGLKAD